MRVDGREKAGVHGSYRKIIALCVMLTLVLIGIPIVYTMVKMGMFSSEPEITTKITAGEDAPVLKIVGDSEFKPQSYLNSNGEPAGANVEVAMEAANRLGMKPEFVFSDWITARDSLNSGDADIILGLEIFSNMKGVLKTVPVFSDHLNVYGKVKVTDAASLAGKKAALMAQSVIIPTFELNCEYVEYYTNPEILQALENGEVDYAICHGSIARDIIKAHDYDIVECFTLMESYPAIGVREDEVKLHENLNQVLQEMADDGTIKEIEEKWITSNANEGSYKDVIKNNNTFYMWYFVLFIFMEFLMAVFIIQSRYYTKSMRENTSKLKRLAYVDPITNGMNINAFKEQLKDELCEDNETIILVNIKNFKLYNVNLGKNGGDELLKTMYDILNTSVKEGECVTRYYADIFYIYLKTDDQNAVLDFISKANKKIKAEAETYLGKNDIKLEFVINYGISTINKNKQLQLAFDEARMACKERQAHENGIPKFYNKDIHETLERNQLLLSTFKDSIENHDFKIYLQAKVDPYKHTIYGGEVLVRWMHPTLGFIAPNDFIPLLENNGYIASLDFYMFEEVCKEMKKFIDQGKPIYPASINLSGAHFTDRSFPEKYYHIAHKYQIPTEYLELELTETFFIHKDSIRVMQENIRKLHEYGFKVAMDDFGSGIATLSMLGYLDVDVLKIDKAFTDNMNNPRNLPILKAISSVARELHISTVVEGVEDSMQLDIVKQYQFDYVQGYIYSKPMFLPEFVEWFKKF